MSVRYYYRKYVCSCGKEDAVMTTLLDWETKPAPKCECGKTPDKVDPHLKRSTVPRFIGHAKSRGLYDIDDTESPDAADRNIHHSMSLMEQAGKLDKKYMGKNGGMVKEAQRKAKANRWSPNTH